MAEYRNKVVLLLPAVWLAVAFFVLSCTGRVSTFGAEGGDTIPMRHARNITMVRYGDRVKVELANPWGGGLLATYVLQSHDADVPEGVSREQLVKVPLTKALVFTSVHCGLICELGEEERIGGVCERKYIHCLTRPVVDCGNGMSPNQERIIQLHPDAMLISPFESNTGYDKLGQLGIPIIQCAEYMEPTALGRAEWMKFYGLLVGREKEACAMFDAIESHYDSLKALTANVSRRPVILNEMLYGNVWYQPGVRSTIGQLYSDAGAQTIFTGQSADKALGAGESASGSVPLSAEQVFACAHDADFWLVRYNDAHDKDLSWLASQADIYSRFRAFQTGNVWACNVATSFFYERSPFHPDRLLSDVIQIAHPELHLSAPMHYYHHLP